LTEEEFARLLSIARTRPLDDARTIRRGESKGERFAELRPEVVQALDELGRERVLIYRTLILTGLRLNELRTLAVGNLDLTPGNESVRLEVRNEKNGAGSILPIRSDLAEELRQWIDDRKLTFANCLFTVPAGLRRILDRDLKAAGIPKRDDRGRSIDVHALRHTFATWLSSAGVAPRTAQAAMRHSDIKLTMGVCTDPAQLAVRDALEKLPSMATTKNRDLNRDLENDSTRQNVTIAVKEEQLSKFENEGRKAHETLGNVDEKTPVTTPVITGVMSGWRDLNPRPLAPQESRVNPCFVLKSLQFLAFAAC